MAASDQPEEHWDDSAAGSDHTRALPRQVVSRGGNGRRDTGRERGYAEERQDTYPDDAYSDGYPDDGYRDDGYPDDRGGPPGPPRRPARRSRARFRLRRAMVVLILLAMAYVGAMAWAGLGIWNSIARVDATPTASNRPEGASGSNFVLVGTDSRENLSRDQRNDLVTGSAAGARADTIMVLHLPSSGAPTLLSIPRDSYVEIPGEGFNKINAAYAIGGPAMLVDTIEQSTGLPISGYLEIGFGGFVDVVAKVDGVRMCLEEPVVDAKTKLDLPAGCQDLVGKEALNYVRMRYGDRRGDLGRVERQRAFLAALTQKLATPSTMLVPWRLHDVGTTTGAALAIGEDTSMWETGRMAWAMRSISAGDGQSLTVPVENPNYSTSVGSTVLWNEAKSEALFEALNTDAPLSEEP